jgi:AcrR family transcriptional regulator
MKNPLKPRKKASQERSQETVTAILEAATHILTEGESHEISTNKIAVKAGVSIGSLYQYFPSKESILNSLLEKHLTWKLEMISKRLDEILASKKAPEKVIEEFVDLLIELKLKNLKFERALTFYFTRANDMETLKKLDEKMIEKINATFLPHRALFPGFDPEWSIFILFYTLRGVIINTSIQRTSEVKNPKLRKELVRLLKGYLLQG